MTTIDPDAPWWATYAVILLLSLIAIIQGQGVVGVGKVRVELEHAAQLGHGGLEVAGLARDQCACVAHVGVVFARELFGGLERRTGLFDVSGGETLLELAEDAFELVELFVGHAVVGRCHPCSEPPRRHRIKGKSLPPGPTRAAG